MTTEEMHEAVSKYGLKDNPFDVIVHQALELARDAMFYGLRYRDPAIASQFCPNIERVYDRADSIRKQMTILSELPDDVVTLFRIRAHYHDNETFDCINEYLLRQERSMDTVYVRSVPSHDDNVEQVLLGPNSDRYKRMVKLREIAKELNQKKGLSDYLSSLVDVIERPEISRSRFMSAEDFKDRLAFISKHNLTAEDVMYLQSYLDAR